MLPDRFLDKISPEPNTGCWLWVGGGSRYGKFDVWNKGIQHQLLAHRFVYETEIGPIPEGTEIDHLCRQPLCVNPAHLEAVPHQVNISRSIRVTRKHCINGHLREGNTVICKRRNGETYRACRICERAKWTRSNTKRRKTENING